MNSLRHELQARTARTSFSAPGLKTLQEPLILDVWEGQHSMFSSMSAMNHQGTQIIARKGHYVLLYQLNQETGLVPVTSAVIAAPVQPVDDAAVEFADVTFAWSLDDAYVAIVFHICGYHGFDADLQRIVTLSVDWSAMASIAYQPNGQCFAASSFDGASVYDSQSFVKHVFTLNLAEFSVTRVAFSPDGRYLGTSARDLTVDLQQQPASASQACLKVSPHSFGTSGPLNVQVQFGRAVEQAAGSTSCKLPGQLVLQTAEGHALQTWKEGSRVAAEQSACMTFDGTVELATSKGGSWTHRAAEIYQQVANIIAPKPSRRLLQDAIIENPTDCAATGSLVTEYVGCVAVVGTYPQPPPRKQWNHWTVDATGVNFAVEVAPLEWGNSWAGLGWSMQGLIAHPPQMINATSVIGWVDLDNTQHINVYDLWSKTVRDVRPSYDQYDITNSSIEYTTDNYLVLRFRRTFDSVFYPGKTQRMITAHGHRIRGLSQHGHRAAVLFEATGQGNMFVVPTRLSVTDAQAHAWCMFIAFGIFLPAGIIWARYFRDLFGKWYFLHMGIQIFGLLLALAGFLVAVTQFNPFPRSSAHFQLGLSVIVLSLLQPLNSIPRLTMHHAHVMRSVYWAYLHWICGRVAVIFGWINIFLGFAKYRTQFNLGSWPEAAFGLYLGVIVAVCLILEHRNRKKEELRRREEDDEMSARISMLEERLQNVGRDRGMSYEKGVAAEESFDNPEPHDDDDLLDQFDNNNHMTRRKTLNQPPPSGGMEPLEIQNNGFQRHANIDSF
ncbi:hypothetical protein WJX73_003763 [Symbiochloris irregularis]|uniref:Cytochrome b561 domain-containing protein n=1 Tax=Symbiochloris irregularis TaxID=706552 RepID=A0AAW1PHU0_9CHLO